MSERINPSSREWRLVEDWALKRLHDWRRQLESTATDEPTTILLRGKISAARDLLKLGLPTPQPTEEDYAHD